MEEIDWLPWLFDGLLGSGLLWLAWRALACPDLFKAIVLFIAFGLLMALAWVRLDAPDIALAEAAIGAGLTGALLLAALARLAPAGTDSKPATPDTIQWLPLTALLLVAAGLGFTLYSLPPDSAGLGSDIATRLASSGVENPVTAVLLNFRAYDTLLEVIVLLVALLGVWSMGGTTQHHGIPPGAVLHTLSRLLVPVLIMVAGYFLWVGANAPGGAFQAGSVLAAAGVLLLLTGFRPHTDLMVWPIRLILILGPATFLVIAVISLLLQGQLLEYPPQQAARLILILESTATLSIGTTLAALFLGSLSQDRAKS